jgi:hypothetical protein
MKLYQFPRLFPVSVRSPLRLLLCSLTLCGTTLLTAAPAGAQTFYRPLQNRSQASQEVWAGVNRSLTSKLQQDIKHVLHTMFVLNLLTDPALAWRFAY